MFTISNEAEQYIADLFNSQNDNDLGLRINIENADTPVANVSFNFCYPKELPKTFKKFNYNGFDAYVDEDNLRHLVDSRLEFKGNVADKQLSIIAPNAKGSPPASNATLEEKIRYTIIADVNPSLASHGGFVELLEIKIDKSVVLNFGGGCQGCSSVKVTLKNGVERQLRQKYPEIKRILDATDHSDTNNAYM